MNLFFDNVEYFNPSDIVLHLKISLLRTPFSSSTHFTWPISMLLNLYIDSQNISLLKEK
jgi:hypothetical protein